MAKLKEKTNYKFEFPDQVELEDAMKESVHDVIQNIYADLAARQGMKPTMRDVMLEMAMRLAGCEQATIHSAMDNILHAQNKPRTKLDTAQEVADKLWAQDASKSKRQIAAILAKRGMGSYEYLRKNLVKSPAT